MPMTPALRTVRRAALASIALLATSACAHLPRRGGSPDFEISSLKSVYSPAGRFLGSWRVTRDAIEVRVDSALVTAPWPGSGTGAEPMVMREDGRIVDVRPLVAIGTRVKALLVTEAPLTPGQPRAWTAHAESAPVTLADTLRLGDVRTATDLRFRIARPADVPLERAWLVFQLESATKPGEDGATGRTFACSAHNLAGPREAAAERAGILADNYTLAC
jgi:hypothetical protein